MEISIHAHISLRYLAIQLLQAPGGPAEDIIIALLDEYMKLLVGEEPEDLRNAIAAWLDKEILYAND